MIYYHFNIPTVGPFRCADTHITKAITRREFSKRNKAKFCKALHNTSWDLLYSIEDAHDHGRPQGGARRGTCPPPLEMKKYRGPHKDNLTRKNKKKYLTIKRRN